MFGMLGDLFGGGNGASHTTPNGAGGGGMGSALGGGGNIQGGGGQMMPSGMGGGGSGGNLSPQQAMEMLDPTDPKSASIIEWLAAMGITQDPATITGGGIDPSAPPMGGGSDQSPMQPFGPQPMDYFKTVSQQAQQPPAPRLPGLLEMLRGRK